jgi:hypothetical protein
MRPLMWQGCRAAGWSQGWRDVPMVHTASRAAPSGGVWRAAVVPAAPACPGGRQPRLEFTVVEAADDGGEDRPPSGGSYSCPVPGGYKLQHGRLQPFPNAWAPPSMLVRAGPPPSHAAAAAPLHAAPRPPLPASPTAQLLSVVACKGGGGGGGAGWAAEVGFRV